ncbi:hypothetical protein G7054_g2876 [Neopestalotiopsis clavispora]|nr:hypothetical protein G7054_g2876 [Neopestalotiopsis clavispora]
MRTSTFFVSIPAALGYCLLSASIGSAKHHQHPRYQPVVNERDTTSSSDAYDYVVVGSGPGGGPLAANLAIAGYSVLLIDAGGDAGTDYTESVPALHLFSTEYEEQKWDFFVNHYSDLERQKKDSKMSYRTTDGDLYVGLEPPEGAEPLGILYPRSGALGGCSRHNALITIGAHDSDWNYIANLTGDDSWASSNMVQYFEQIEKARYLPSSVVGHGYNGWLTTELTSLSLVVEDQKLLSLIIAAATGMGKHLLTALVSTVVGLGQVLLRDINAPGQTSQTGLYQVPLSMENNVRGGPRDFILNTANAVNSDGSRKYKLDVKLNTLVTKVRFDESGSVPKAVGVDYLEGASLYRADPRSTSATETGSGSVNATREVILAAGAFNTPQLLKLSGVGPRDELESFDIPVVVDLPGVGGNMQDRYEATLVGKTDSDFVITSKCTFLQTMPDPCLDAYTTGIDPITKGVYGTNGIAIAIIQKSSVAEDEPDLLISGAPANFRGYFPGYANDSLSDAQHWAWIVLKAHSRNNAGTVKLQSTDPRDMPLINFYSFDTGVNANGEGDKDLQAVYEGFEFGRRAFADLIPLDGSFPETWPGAATSDEEDVKDFLKNEAWGHHASCTAAIGPDGDPNAVLDSNFKVRGVEGLRVVDASVFPKIPGFYIALPLYMVSQKASEVIINDAKSSGFSFLIILTCASWLAASAAPSLPQSPALSLLSSRATNSGSNTDCTTDVDNDLYGKGVRIGLYLQWASGFILRQLESWETRARVRISSNIITGALAIATAVNIAQGSALSVDYLLSYYLTVVLFYAESYNLETPKYLETLPPNSHEAQLYNDFDGEVVKATKGIGSGARTVAAYYGRAAMVMSAGPVDLWAKASFWPGIFRPAFPLASLSRGFVLRSVRDLCHYFLIYLAGPLVAVVSIERMIAANNLVTDSAFSSAGQLIPFITGIVSLLLACWETVQKIWKIRRSGPSRRHGSPEGSSQGGVSARPAPLEELTQRETV